MADFEFTAEQREALETVDRSVLVSAAAGSGKTAVLAGRCAYVVCDAPEPYRCDVDRLLVVTFTEAAAAQMKERICGALARRRAASPHDQRLRWQLALIDTAQISTLHAFCWWMVRRWFHRAGVDATAQLLDADEARLLREETLTELFNDLYRSQGGLGSAFRTLVEDYGLGYDGEIAAFVVQLAEFVVSLPDAGEWLSMAGDDSATRRARVLAVQREALAREVGRQAEYCAEVADAIGTDVAAAAFYGELVRGYAEQLQDWRVRLADSSQWEQVRGEINEHGLSSRSAPRLSADASEEVHARRDQARVLLVEVRDKLLAKRLQAGLCRFSAEELEVGLRQVGPQVKTMSELAREFLRRWGRAKRNWGVMDFSDLERLAYKLLKEGHPEGGGASVAAELRERFVHVLVDEFQDINPLQARILSLVSREEVSGAAGNLFAVGDVKQSIYRFRLAEPAKFLERQQAFRVAPRPEGGVCFDLQANFRSRAVVLRGVNSIFSRLMHVECGAVAYDERAMLKSPPSGADGGGPAEVHILERRVEVDDRADDEERFVDVTDPAQWRTIEREGFLIGRRLRAMMAAGFTVRGKDGDRPLQYRDVCVLLRSARHSAEPLAAMLNQMGIPTWADAAEGLFAAVEVRDVLALLRVLDNVQQDIPLAAVLRSGILGEGLSEDELAEIRVFDRVGAFHEAVCAYARCGPQDVLREKLSGLLRRVQRYRELVRHRPLADVLWMIYRETDYLAFVGGLAGGTQRRANLFALHERARQFGQFRRQGLHRFLRFVETLEAGDGDLGSPSTLGEGDDVVHIMSIHKAKGLEFPVVFAAELGRGFNLSDASGRFLLDRDMGIGLKAVDRERLIEYPTALHSCCARSSLEASLAEELRVWYVAMTRAADRLILVGSERLEAVRHLRTVPGRGSDRLGPLRVLAAASPLHWVVSVLGSMGCEQVRWDEPPSVDERVEFAVTTYDAMQIQSWSLPGGRREEGEALRRAVAALEPLPGGEPLSAASLPAEEVMGRLDYAYPHLGTSSVRAARAASEVRRAYAAAGMATDDVPLVPTGAQVGDGGEEARHAGALRGQVVHKALQFLRLERTGDAEQVAGELRRLVAEGVLGEEEAELVAPQALVWFFSTDLGRRIRGAADGYLREWMFVAAEPVRTFDPTVSGDAGEDVLVRGVVDGVLVTAEGVEIVDFKTDRVSAGAVRSRAAEYAMQMRLYSSAVAEVFGRPVRFRHLVFLHSRQIIEV